MYLNSAYAQFNRVSRVNLSTIKYGAAPVISAESICAINMDALKITVASPRDLIGLAFLFFPPPLHVALDIISFDDLRNQRLKVVVKILFHVYFLNSTISTNAFPI